MLNQLVLQYTEPYQTFKYLLVLVNALIHILFAGAVARDAGSLNKVGQKTALVSGGTWAFASLLGGVFTVAIYWFIHHSTITRPGLREIR